MDGELVRQVAALCDLDRIDLADQVGDRDVGCRQLLAVAVVALDPRDLDRIAFPCHQVKAATADWVVGMVVDLASGDGGHRLVEEADQRAHDPALRLAALAEKNDVVPRDHRVGELRQDGFVVADDAGQKRLTGAQAGEQVAAHLLLDGLAPVPGRAKLGDGARPWRGHPCTIDKALRKLD